MKRKSAIAIICVLAVLLLAAPLSYAWFSYSLKSEAHMDSYVHKSYFESGDGTGATQFAGSGLSSEEGCAFEIKYPVQLYYFAWLQALGYFNIPQNGSEIEQVYFYLSDDLDMTLTATVIRYPISPFRTLRERVQTHGRISRTILPG